MCIGNFPSQYSVTHTKRNSTRLLSNKALACMAKGTIPATVTPASRADSSQKAFRTGNSA